MNGSSALYVVWKGIPHYGSTVDFKPLPSNDDVTAAYLEEVV